MEYDVDGGGGDGGGGDGGAGWLWGHSESDHSSIGGGAEGDRGRNVVPEVLGSGEKNPPDVDKGVEEVEGICGVEEREEGVVG